MIGFVPNIIELETTTAKRHVERVDFLKGSPQDPLTLAECLEKFRQCAAFCGARVE